MILLFHSFVNLCYLWLRRYFNKTSVVAFKYVPPEHQNRAEWNKQNNLFFQPPMYIQRYERVTDILIHEKWRQKVDKIVDFGCSTFQVFTFFKNTLRMGELCFVDVDEAMLEEHYLSLYPLSADHINKRTEPLTLKIYCGSVAQPDPRMLNTDAVVAIELIEHLYPDVLEALPYNIFSYIRPRLVIITTPNSDFNPLFGGAKKFRHLDHKFEWNQEQFKEWAENIISRFPSYAVYFDGIGYAPEGIDSKECCSQLALFVRKDVICDNYIEEVVSCSCMDSPCKNLDDNQSQRLCPCVCVRCNPKNSYGICSYLSHTQYSYSCDLPQDGVGQFYYKLLSTINYPHRVDSRSEEEKIVDQVRYKLELFERGYYNGNKCRSEIPLKKLTYSKDGEFITENELRSILLKFSFQIEECFVPESNSSETCVIYVPEMDVSSSGNDTEASGNESDKYCSENWDDVESPPKASTPELSNGEDITPTLNSGDEENRPECLIDCSCQKSIPNDESGKTFREDQTVTVAKNHEISEIPPTILPDFESCGPEKINELDIVRKEKKFLNLASLQYKDVKKKICQEIKHPVAGPSNIINTKLDVRTPSENDESNPVEDAKSIANCLLENSLNKIEPNDEQERGNLIEHQFIEVEVIGENRPIVENGDLANNNRDKEGNNYRPDEHVEVENNDEEAVDNQVVNNVNVHNNNQIVLIEDEVQDVRPEIENPDVQLPVDEPEVVAWSSREALYDSNSHVDLLEDFEMDAAHIDEAIALSPNLVMIAGNLDVINGMNNEAVPLLPDEPSFPHWLLQIFEEDEPVAEDDLHDEPHFYCQGDGLGVHPSTVNINDDEAETDEDSNSSASGSVDLANEENDRVAPSEIPTERNTDTVDLAVVGQSIESHNDLSTTSEQEEFYETAEEPDSSFASSSNLL